MLTTSSICTKLEGEQGCGPQPHRSFNDDGDYLNILQKFTLYPDYYDHDPSATVHTLFPIDENLSSSRMDNVPRCTLPENPDFVPHLPLGLFLDHQDLLVDGARCTEGASPPPPMSDVNDPFLTMGSQGPALELPAHTFTNDQRESSWGSHPSPLPDRNNQPHPLTFFPQESPCGPRAHLPPESHIMTGPTSEPASLVNPDILIYNPISEQEDNGARSSLLPQADMVAIQQSITSFITATIPIDEGSHHPVTQRQAFLGADGIAELSMTGLYVPSLYPTSPSARPKKEAPSPTYRRAIQASRDVSWTPPIASRQFAQAGENHSKFWCSVCDIGFAQKQGLNRHERDQHGPQNVCHLCTYKWSPGRKYKFTEHLNRHHPEAVLC